jgi:hypothetical protein
MITSLTEKTIDGVVIHERNKNDERKPLKFHRAIIMQLPISILYGIKKLTKEKTRRN